MARKRYADEGGDASPKRVRTSTKVVLVAAGWVLLTLFLIGQFSSDAEQAADRARLDTVAGTDVDGDGDVDEVVEEDATDVNGDGIIEVGEGVEEGMATASVDDGGASPQAAGSGSGPSGSGGSSAPGASVDVGVTDGDGGRDSAPGAAQTGGTTATTSRAGSGGATTTTAGGTGGSSGGSSATTTTTSGGSGGSGGASTTTTTPATSTAGSPIILIVEARDERYEYPAGFGADLHLPVGSQIRLDNIEANAGVRHSFTIAGFWDSGKIRSGDGTRTSPPLPQGTYTYTCTEHPVPMRGTITVESG